MAVDRDVFVARWRGQQLTSKTVDMSDRHAAGKP
jgi:hypothetical protein